MRDIRRDVDVVVVTYNSSAVIGPCLDGLATQDPAVGVIVVDNDSADDTRAIVEAHPINARWIDSGGNWGYAAAVNIGIEASSADAILVLNPDTEVSPGAIARLAAALDQPGRGVAAPRITNAEGGLELTIRRFPTVLRLLGQTLAGSGPAGRFAWAGDTVVDRAAYERAGQHDWCSGAANLVSRECLDAVGRWDESFFLYSEETDFAWRASQLGFATVFVPDAHVQHIGGDSGVSPRLWSILVTNRVRFMQLHHSRLHARAFWLVSVLGEALRSFRPRNRAALVALVTGRLDPAVVAARERQQEG